ncbi:MAG TPA: zinc ribbon domain-containing protein [Rhodothermales bacterium]
MAKTRECPSCALEIDARAETCPYCGYELPTDKLSWKLVAIVAALLLAWPLFEIIRRFL